MRNGSEREITVSRKSYYDKDLRLLVETGAAREFLVRRTEDGQRWMLLIRVAVAWTPIRSQRELVRTWASLDTLERFAGSMGITKMIIER